ncbi:hypothetical protein OPT61_g9314 [Boeremia exigua]|uniref:Uncharacterized protein n=1 Tax=Boeremia exigua TaxID=749465 RepID=A0ACC2HV29_9PLEO|nr:hypothetical protein OPT61_g9314 [Boeremia exigua]
MQHHTEPELTLSTRAALIVALQVAASIVCSTGTQSGGDAAVFLLQAFGWRHACASPIEAGFREGEGESSQRKDSGKSVEAHD